MVVYHCLRCGKKQSQKSHWRDHLGRKKPCESTYLNISGAEIIENYTDLLPKYLEMIEDKKKIYRCDSCPFKSEYKRNYTRHLKKCEKSHANSEIESLKRRLQLLESQVQASNTNIGEINIEQNNTTFVNGDNTTNHYYLCGFGNENTSAITVDELNDIIKTKTNAVNNFNRLIRSKPENMNLYVQNVRSNYMKVFNGVCWESMNKMVVIEDLVTNTIDQLQTLINEHKDELPSSHYNTVNRTLEHGTLNSTVRQRYDKNRKKYIKQIQTDLIDMRNMVKCSYEQGTGYKLISRGY